MIAASQPPDHATIARFRVRHEQALARALRPGARALRRRRARLGRGPRGRRQQVRRRGLRRGIRSYEQIATEIIEEAGRIDAAEDEHPRPAPRRRAAARELATREGRRAWLREAKARPRARAGRARRAGPERARRTAAALPAPARRGLARRALREPATTRPTARAGDRARRADGFGTRAAHTSRRARRGSSTSTDPDARRMKRTSLPPGLQRPGGHDRAADRDRRRTNHRGRRLPAARADDRLCGARAPKAGVKDSPGSCSPTPATGRTAHRRAEGARHGPDRRPRHRAATNRGRPGRLGGPYDYMRRVFATEQGGALYSQRPWMVEPVFAHIKFEPADRPLQTQGTGGRPLGMAPDRRHPQPPEAHRHSLQAAGGQERPRLDRSGVHRPRRCQLVGTFARQPPWEAAVPRAPGRVPHPGGSGSPAPWRTSITQRVW